MLLLSHEKTKSVSHLKRLNKQIHLKLSGQINYDNSNKISYRKLHKRGNSSRESYRKPYNYDNSNKISNR